MIPVNYNETNTYLTPDQLLSELRCALRSVRNSDQLISELRTEIKHLNREYELLERTATGALSIVIEQIEIHKVRFKHGEL